MTPQYRQWLQGIVNGTVSGGSPANRTEASALLQVVGDDGNVNDYFLSDPYAYTGDDRGQVFSTTEGSGNNIGYGPEGITTTNNAFKQLYLNEYPDGFNPPTGGSVLGSTGTADADAEKARLDAERTSLRNEITGKGGEVESIYGSLFGDLDTLLRSRDTELEGQYGDQLKKAGESYAGAIPEIETSYAALGAADSTDNTYAKVKAKKGFEDTTETIGKNKETDKAKVGQYGQEQRAKFTADKESATRNIGRAGETTDVDALRSMRNDIETNISGAGVTKATLGTEGSARKALSDLTADSGRYETAINALDSILKSSLSGSVKEAAVQAITDSSGLSEEEKKRVQETYGNVYAEQAAL